MKLSKMIIGAVLVGAVSMLGCGDDQPQTPSTGGTNGGTGGTNGGTGGNGTGGNGTGGTNGGGDVQAGLYRMQVSSPGSDDYWEVCFFVGADRSTITADSSCDVDQNDDDPYSFDFTTQVGSLDGGGDCNFNFSYDDDITINADGTFGVSDWTPAPGFSPTFSFSGTINGSSASGTASGTNIPVINNCSFNWMATHSQ